MLSDKDKDILKKIEQDTDYYVSLHKKPQGFRHMQRSLEEF